MAFPVPYYCSGGVILQEIEGGDFFTPEYLSVGRSNVTEAIQ